MTTTLFCYCCRVHHAKDQMRLFPTRQGMRWRCIASIEGAYRPQAERDAFGRQQSAMNREATRRQAEYASQIRAGVLPMLVMP